MMRADRISRDALGDEERGGLAKRCPRHDLEELAHHAAGDGLGLKVVVGDGRNQVVKPVVVTEGDEGEVVRDLETPLGEPTQNRQHIAGSRNDEGGGGMLEIEAAIEQVGDAVRFAASRIDGFIDDLRVFVKDDIRCVMEQVALDGSIIDHIAERTLTPGHAIEGAWFILHEARRRCGDAELTGLGLRMLDYMWERGWDDEFGGILYFRDVHGKPVQEYWQDMKFWWPQNEAIIATLLAYIQTGEEKYAGWHRQVHHYAHQHFHDPEHGEWFGYLHRDGRISVPLKGNQYKGPFHLPRMQWYCWQLLENRSRQSGL